MKISAGYTGKLTTTLGNGRGDQTEISLQLRAPFRDQHRKHSQCIGYCLSYLWAAELYYPSPIQVLLMDRL